MGPRDNDYAAWSEQELRRAESEADRFLNENQGEIRENLEGTVAHLNRLVKSLGACEMPLDERLDCFARIAEAARALEEDAEGFFSLAREPVVARLLAQVETKRR
ncbi:MAG: hypothetical protein LAP39_09030 [Acidobacteriia bacterium]|nr:hypothetical protein [Terriglobia bacterium]